MYWAMFTCLFFVFSTIRVAVGSRDFSSGTITVGGNNTELFYTDSGAPDTSVYTTIFAVHGLSFNGAIFAKTQDLATKSNIRVVSINRRNYRGSTPFTDAEVSAIANGTDEQKSDWYNTRGQEILYFMDSFIQKESLPAIDEEGKGGVALLGWSLGNPFTLSAIANINSVSEEVSSRLALYTKTLFIQEPSEFLLGYDNPPQTYEPIFDDDIPEDKRSPMFIEWVTGYFKHGNLSSHDRNQLEWVVPAIYRVPSIFNFTENDYSNIIEGGVPSTMDSHILTIPNLLMSAYKAASYDAVVRDSLPNMEVVMLAGTNSPAFGPDTFWIVEKDNLDNGGSFVTLDLIDTVNHMMNWDDPEIAISTYAKYI